MKTVLQCALMLVVVLIGAPGYPAPSLTLYDNFNAMYIDPDKWFGAELAPQAGGGTGGGTEAIRQIQGRRLRLLYRAYGRKVLPTAPTTEILRRELDLIMQNSATVTAIEATVQVAAVTTTGCPGNSEHTLAWARLGGRFFASGGNDVVAIIYLGRRSDTPEPSNVLHARAGVFHCADPACTKASDLFPAQDLGAVKLRQTARLRVQWEQGNHRFIFQRNKAPEVVMPYTVTDTDPPSMKAKLLSATLSVPDCTSTTTPRPKAFIDALFDDVKVNK
jgi:hypothetical protein